MPDNRRGFLAKMLALVPASIIGRGFLKSANVPKALHGSDTPLVALERINGKLPEGWHLYECCGQSIFPLYGASGGLCTSQMAYLVCNRPNPFAHFNVDGGDLGWPERWECIPVEFTDLQFIHTDYDTAMMTSLINAKIAYAIKYRKPQPINLDGGTFPCVTQAERDAEAAWSQELEMHLTGVIPTLYGAPRSFT